VPLLEFVSKSLRSGLASRVGVEGQDYVFGAGELRDASREGAVGQARTENRGSAAAGARGGERVGHAFADEQDAGPYTRAWGLDERDPRQPREGVGGVVVLAARTALVEVARLEVPGFAGWGEQREDDGRSTAWKAASAR
jgi:hypothetical protein